MANEHDIKVLNSLITTTIDSAHGFEQSAEDAEAAASTTCSASSPPSGAQVVALRRRCARMGGTPE